jgi:hypothetical protein
VTRDGGPDAAGLLTSVSREALPVALHGPKGHEAPT